MVRLSTRKKDEREDGQAKKASSTVSPAYILRSALRERERDTLVGSEGGGVDCRWVWRIADGKRE